MQAASRFLNIWPTTAHLAIFWLALNVGLSGCAQGGHAEASGTRTASASSSPSVSDHDQESTPPFVPKTGQHGLIVRCGGGRATETNPLRVTLALLNDPESFFDHHVARAKRLHEITGNARIVFHMLNGWDEGGMWHSAAVLDAMPPRRRAAFERAVRTLTDAGIAVGTYSAAKVPNRIDSVRIEDVGVGEHFEYDNPRHYETMMAIFKPLIELGVEEIWLDNTSPEAAREDWVKMAKDLRSLGAYMVMEATPLTRPRPRQLHLDTIQHVASASWNRRIYLHNDLEDDHWLPLPENTELIAVISAHQTHDRTVPTERRERQRYLLEQTAKRLQQGFTVFNMQEEIDDEYFALIQAWTEHQASRSSSDDDS